MDRIELARRRESAMRRSGELAGAQAELADRHRRLMGEVLTTVDERIDAGGASDGRVERALELSRRVGRAPEIEQAKLIVAKRKGCTPGEAFDLLVRESQHRNRKVRDLAAAIVRASEPQS